MALAFFVLNEVDLRGFAWKIGQYLLPSSITLNSLNRQIKVMFYLLDYQDSLLNY